MNVEGCSAIFSPFGPAKLTDTFRSGLPTDFVPVASRIETRTRSSPTPSSLDTIVGSTAGDPLPPADGGEPPGAEADGDPGLAVHAAATRTIAARAAEGMRWLTAVA